jgi:hypothetical protein
MRWSDDAPTDSSPPLRSEESAMKKEKPLTPYERPMALRRSFLLVVPLVAVLFVIKALTSSPVLPLGEVAPQQLATSMGKALLHVQDMTFTAASQVTNQGQTAAVGGSFSVERNGNYQISGQSEQDPALTGEIRDIGGTLYFRYAKAAIYKIMRLVPQRVSDHEARVAAAALGGRWFTTGDAVSTSGNAPPTPSNARQLFSSLGITDWSTFSKGTPTTNQGVTVVPLSTGSVTWFVPAVGPRLPNAIAFYNYASTAGPIGFLASGSTVQVSYARVVLSAPTHLARVPTGFGAQWNAVLPAQHISKLNAYGLLWLALVPHP